MKKAHQISESIELGILLSLSGGFMDAYSYMARGKVIANAQTGNMLLLGIYLSQGQYMKSFYYFLPVFAFALGIALTAIVRLRNKSQLHWRQISVFVEGIILLIVAFIPFEMNLLANSLTSFACGLQVQSFRKIHDKPLATTMCIGNLRGGTENICYYFVKKEKHYLEKGLIYYGIILFFIFGAIIGNIFVYYLSQYAIMFCSILLMISFLIMFKDRENQKK